MKNKLFSFRVKKLGKDLAQNDRLVINALKYGVSIILFLLCGSLLILLQGQSPLAALEAIFQGAFGNKMAIGNTLRWTAPCIMTGAAAILASASRSRSTFFSNFEVSSAIMGSSSTRFLTRSSTRWNSGMSIHSS